MALQLQCNAYNLHFPTHPSLPSTKIFSAASSRRALSLFAITGIGLSNFGSSSSICSWAVSDFVDLPNSGGVKALELRIGDKNLLVPFEFVLGSGKVISGIESAVRSMKVGGIRRVVIPRSEGYQNTSQEPIPPNFFDRQRLFTTIFNPTRLANGEGSTLGIIIFDIELLSLRRH
ncbi:hypothetical protein MIMGU_mgv1a022762mg [Erythranthe guttata]|uniref:peptidylprolyl isomerase n=1 Tax=Erythranthe guttata TaxID=4155 RepID=A0A022PZD7_ERYGU|nr:hypothetical protein MIMGU_mgv1a022762mg [Erythranthe guttata]